MLVRMIISVFFFRTHALTEVIKCHLVPVAEHGWWHSLRQSEVGWRNIQKEKHQKGLMGQERENAWFPTRWPLAAIYALGYLLQAATQNPVGCRSICACSAVVMAKYPSTCNARNALNMQGVFTVLLCNIWQSNHDGLSMRAFRLVIEVRETTGI